MPWYQLSVELGRVDLERAEAALFGCGALAVTIHDAAGGSDEQSVLEPAPGELHLWPTLHVTGLFTITADLEAIKQQLALELSLESTPVFHVTELEDRVWEREWLEHFKPQRYGERLWVVPVDQPVSDPGSIFVELDPGLAFGTGNHPTTALCLEWLDSVMPPGCQLLDFGCGSGILAIAALRLGADCAVAVDHDPQARLAAIQNAERNGVSARMQVCGPGDLGERDFDVLIANIVAGVLVKLASEFAHRVRPGGMLVLSGLLEPQIDQVATEFGKWFDILQVFSRDNWSRLTALRK